MSANFAGAFLGIVVTFGTTAVIDMHARKSMARRAELIAIAHIDNDIMQLEAICEEMQETDSLYRFVYERHPDRLAEISRDTIDLLLSSMMLPQLLLSNQSAEKAFSNSMETWHDFNDLNLLYSINTCFSLKNTISDLYETVAAYHTEACDSTFEQFERQKKRDDKPTALVRVHESLPADTPNAHTAAAGTDGPAEGGEQRQQRKNGNHRQRTPKALPGHIRGRGRGRQ